MPRKSQRQFLQPTRNLRRTSFIVKYLGDNFRLRAPPLYPSGGFEPPPSESEGAPPKDSPAKTWRLAHCVTRVKRKDGVVRAQRSIPYYSALPVQDGRPSCAENAVSRLLLSPLWSPSIRGPGNAGPAFDCNGHAPRCACQRSTRPAFRSSNRPRQSNSRRACGR